MSSIHAGGIRKQGNVRHVALTLGLARVCHKQCCLKSKPIFEGGYWNIIGVILCSVGVVSIFRILTCHTCCKELQETVRRVQNWSDQSLFTFAPAYRQCQCIRPLHSLHTIVLISLWLATFRAPVVHTTSEEGDSEETETLQQSQADRRSSDDTDWVAYRKHKRTTQTALDQEGPRPAHRVNPTGRPCNSTVTIQPEPTC